MRCNHPSMHEASQISSGYKSDQSTLSRSMITYSTHTQYQIKKENWHQVTEQSMCPTWICWSKLPIALKYSHLITASLKHWWNKRWQEQQARYVKHTFSQVFLDDSHVLQSRVNLREHKQLPYVTFASSFVYCTIRDQWCVVPLTWPYSCKVEVPLARREIVPFFANFMNVYPPSLDLMWCLGHPSILS